VPRDADAAELLTIEGREVRVTHPDKLYFSRDVRLTKLELVRYYLSVAPGALAGIRNRPIVLKRFVNGAEGEAFYQKRAPAERPAWLGTVTLSFPSGRTAEEIVVEDAAGLAWIVNLGCIELHPHPVRAGDLDHPDELRIDLDPGPGVSWSDVRRVSLEVRAMLEDVGLRGWPKTSGSRGMHVIVRVQPRWTFTEVRRAALALSREVERRLPELASSKWWKEERHGVFLDYNQNAKDRTTASAYSVRPLPDARVSAPLRWDEVSTCDPAEFTVLTMPQRFADVGDPHAEIDSAAGSLEPLLELAARDEALGLGDAPWPPHFRKMEGEGARVSPSRAKKAAKKSPTGNVAADPNAAPMKAPAKRSRAKMPLLIIAHSPREPAALAGLERWKQKHPKAAALLAVDDVLVDRMRGRSSTWTRIRVNLRHVPEELRPAQERPDPDDDPTRE
jgi:bifunctional non-homologous end joining protein LigD